MRVNIQEFKTNSGSIESFYYTTTGNEAFFDRDGIPSQKEESKSTFAKKVKNKQSKNLSGTEAFGFYVKAYGNKRLYNPYDKYSIEKSNNPTKIENICKNQEYFLEVNEYIFKKYLNYLKTANKYWLSEAQKDIN